MADQLPDGESSTGLWGRPVSRRSVIRTAAHAAWVVPAIQVVSAVPAFAASGTTTITVAAAVQSWSSTSNNATFDLRVTVGNTGGIPAEGVVVTLTFPARWNPTTTTPPGWTAARSGSTITYTAAASLPLGPTSFTVTINPANAVVRRGSYVADGGGLIVTANATNAAVATTAVDLAGSAANLVITSGSATWSRTGTQYSLACGGTVFNRGRTATSNLRLAVAYRSLGRATGTPTGLAPGWTLQTTYYERTGAELAPGSSAVFAVTRQMTGGQAGTDGTLTLRPTDATLNNEVATSLAIPVVAFA